MRKVKSTAATEKRAIRLCSKRLLIENPVRRKRTSTIIKQEATKIERKIIDLLRRRPLESFRG